MSVSQLSSITSGLSQTSTALQSQLSMLDQQQASDVYSLTSQLNAQASTLQSQLSDVAQTLNQNVSSIDTLVQASANSPVPVQPCQLGSGGSLPLGRLCRVHTRCLAGEAMPCLPSCRRCSFTGQPPVHSFLVAAGPAK